MPQESNTIKLATYIMAQVGVTIGYHDDGAPGTYQGVLDIKEVLKKAVDAKYMDASLLNSDTAQIGYVGFWHVNGLVNESAIVVNQFFIGHEKDATTTTTTTQPTDTTKKTTVTTNDGKPTEADSTTKTTETQTTNPSTFVGNTPWGVGGLGLLTAVICAQFLMQKEKKVR